ncbi:hypothetical protein A6A04_19305 [Paramagnetospirillum marisnigri]|uniref:DUF6969 domain-containing protein n=2 Tax=Paramagnetospirillum marisnigri TaxID=1285242 RepID=A0A178MLE4_9PROT|nr:hypothetical protein [Paramagnetospirillum marisnigri]OAN49496.1 hypothetical protein A6A04_19305 [Paramagnetospirillum marisnigri]
MISLLRAMDAEGANPVSLLLEGVARPMPHRHYPSGDVYDFVNHAQFYYHIHRDGECGHIHLFQRARGMPPGLKPVVASLDPNPPCHLVAIGFGSDGHAAELFTTNRWVTGEAWYDAAALKMLIPRFRLQASGRARLVASWLEALVAFYAAEIAQLADERDRTVEHWQRSHSTGDPLDDPGLEITSHRAIDPLRDAV